MDKVFAEISGWRQHTHLYYEVRNLGHKASKLKKSTSQNPDRVQEREAAIQQTYGTLLDRNHVLLERIRNTQKELQAQASLEALGLVQTIDQFLPHAER